MRFSELTALESGISASGLSHMKKEPFSFPVSGDPALTLTGNVCQRTDGKATYYYQEEIPKERIVLHFTAGHLRGDLVTLMGLQHVSVPYVIARDGTVYQLFDPAFWSYHLGPGAIGGNKAQSSATIGIELSNYGPLVRNENHLETIYSSASARDVYCSLQDADEYVHADQPFRARSYYANFTDIQYDSLILLLRHLTHQFQIPRAFLEATDRFRTSEVVLSHKGIVSHINYRASGKWDIGPAFDWDRVIAGVQAASFTPPSPLEHRIRRKRKQIDAEEEILVKQREKVKTLKKELKEMERQDPESGSGN